MESRKGSEQWEEVGWWPWGISHSSMISGPTMSGDRDLFNLKANHPASLVTKAPAAGKERRMSASLLGSSVQHQLILHWDWCGSPEGTNGGQAVRADKHQGWAMAGRRSSSCGAICRCQGVLTLCLGRAQCCVWSCLTVFWALQVLLPLLVPRAARGAGPGAHPALGCLVS